MMKKKMGFYVLLAVSLGILAWIAGFIWAANSEPYDAARKYIATSPQVIESIGAVKSMRLSMIGYSILYRNSGATAKFCVITDGEKKPADIYLDMVRINNVWQIQSGRISMENGVDLPLSL